MKNMKLSVTPQKHRHGPLHSNTNHALPCGTNVAVSLFSNSSYTCLNSVFSDEQNLQEEEGIAIEKNSVYSVEQRLEGNHQTLGVGRMEAGRREGHIDRIGTKC